MASWGHQTPGGYSSSSAGYPSGLMPPPRATGASPAASPVESSPVGFATDEAEYQDRKLYKRKYEKAKYQLQIAEAALKDRENESGELERAVRILDTQVREFKVRMERWESMASEEKEKAARAQKKLKVALRKLNDRDDKIRRLEARLERYQKSSSNGTPSGPSQAEVVAHLQASIKAMKDKVGKVQEDLRVYEGKKSSRESEWPSQPVEVRENPEKVQRHLAKLKALEDAIKRKVNEESALSAVVSQLEDKLKEALAAPKAVVPSAAISSGGAEGPPTVEMHEFDEDELLDLRPAEPQDARFAEWLTGHPELETVLKEQGVEVWDSFDGDLGRLEISLADCSNPASLFDVYLGWIAHNGQLHRLTMSDTTLDAGMAGRLCESVNELKTVTALELNRCGLTGTVCDILGAELESLTLEEVNFGYNNFGVHGAQALSCHLPSWSASLSVLNLQVNTLGDAGAAELATAFRGGTFPSLGVLDLRWNELKADGAQALADAFGAGACPALAEINLSGNQIRAAGLTALVVSVSRKLRSFDASMNHIDSEALAGIQDWVGQGRGDNPTPLLVNLEWNMIDDDDGLQKLAKALRDASAKVVFILKNNESYLEQAELSAICGDAIKI